MGDRLPIDRSPFEATVPIWSISSEDGAFFERHSKFFTRRGHGEVDAAIAIRLGTHHIWDELIRQRSLARGTPGNAPWLHRPPTQTFTARDASPG
jgi:hypothetical protein